MKNTCLEPYEFLIDFLADYFGENTEVVLHNLSDLESSIHKIRNGHISGRSVGDPITDLVVRAMKNNDSEVHYQCNYLSKTRDGRRLKCATFFIRNKQGEIVGALCLNTVVEDLIALNDKLSHFLSIFVGQTDNNNGTQLDEHIGLTIPEMVDLKINNVINIGNINPESLNAENKSHIISLLNDEGVFLLKGAVTKVAKKLNISEPTVYKYIQKLK
ncbi:PAS domain-containing protein [Salmonella enterica]|uniref:DNA-binding protein n=9 Tax=Enterobacteriaceae TaxID=543 RepID=A0A5I2EGU0_SALPT|nr:PAS domain-containing protein [Salmonella enterica]AAV79253.1 putative DNA-binding protein [Salmonella enterica subsp. enterica serovar Paratyphi A str. ATCC 9150]APV95672.1 DNA-binding protein [Salmonella enterica subsp. enterica serovar Paratyphi A str. ATCC 11511]EBA0152207.1 DNA-binding protein [Salmonella enterica subsp. enterica serovar Enteritidis]EBH8139424.1 DNA-binding protein [Salmonella enterica subsp. enterica serovar Paratyphi A str. AKU_12601]EBX8732566.1 DNA-binding protein 